MTSTGEFVANIEKDQFGTKKKKFISSSANDVSFTSNGSNYVHTLHKETHGICCNYPEHNSLTDSTFILIERI